MHEHGLREAGGAAAGGHGSDGVCGVWDQRRESHEAPGQPRHRGHGTHGLACPGLAREGQALCMVFSSYPQPRVVQRSGQMEGQGS